MIKANIPIINRQIPTMKNIFKTTALFLGFTTCLAGKCPLQNNADNTALLVNACEPEETDDSNNTTKNSHSLAFMQDLDKIYYL